MLDNATNDETCHTITKRAPHQKQGTSWWPHSCHQEKKWAHLDNWLKKPPHKRKRENKGPSQQRGRGEGKDQNTKNNRANKLTPTRAQPPRRYIYIYGKTGRQKPPPPPLPSKLRPPWAPLPLVCDFALSGVMLTAHETEVLPPSWWSFEVPHSNDASSKWQ